VSAVLDREGIKKILPHRDPFLFVDEIEELVEGERIVGLVRVSDTAWCLVEDASGSSFFPPSLLTEAMAQVGAVLVMNTDENRGRTIYFRSIDEIRFDRKVPAGSTVRVEGAVRRLRGRLGSLQVKAYLGDEMVAEGVMGFAL
jgi:3-hydroxyacyl-[acyl-carrier-protein] dehydratase